MTLDIVIFIFLTFIIFLGVKKGGVLQIFKLGAYLAVILCLVHGKLWLSEILSIHKLPIVILYITLAISSVFVYILILFTGKILKQRFLSENINEKIDSFLGGIIGGLKGTLIVCVLTFLTGTLPDWLPLKQRVMNYSFEHSRIFPFIYCYNPLSFISIYKLYVLVNENPDILDQIEDEKIKKILKNSTLKKAAAEKNLSVFLNNTQVKNISQDQELIKNIVSLNIKTAIEKISGKKKD